MAILSFPDRTQTATLSGGSWLTAAPLSNLQDKLLTHVARSSNALAASTLVQIDLGAAVAVRVISLCAHNISTGGTVRVRGFSDAGYTTMVTGADSGTLNAWTAEAIAAGITNYPKNYTFVFTSAKTARYWKIEVVDTSNAAGFVEIGRAWVGAADFEPAVSVSYGASLGYEARDVIEESLGGVIWGEKRTPRRVLSATFNTLTSAEKRAALVMQKTLTTTDEVLWITNGTATADDMLFEAFPAFIRKASPLQYPYYNNHEMPIEIIERV